MKYSTYLIHYNHRHDPKTGRFAKNPNPDRIIPKGTSFNRVSGTKDEKTGKALTYVSSSKLDNNIYTSQVKSIFGNYEGDNYKHNLKTKKDIKVAGRETQVKAFEKILSDSRPEQLVAHTKHLDGSVNNELKKYVEDKDLLKLYKKAKKSKKHFDIAFDAFIQNIDNGGIIAKRFVNDLKKQGYGALSDEYDSKYHYKPGIVDYYSTKTGRITGSAVHTNSATIFLDRHENLKTVKVSEIRNSDIKRAENWLKKNGYIVSVMDAGGSHG